LHEALHEDPVGEALPVDWIETRASPAAW
jgi:hypothetical protein